MGRFLMDFWKNSDFRRKEMFLSVCNTAAPLHSQKIEGGGYMKSKGRAKVSGKSDSKTDRYLSPLTTDKKNTTTVPSTFP